MSDDWDRPRPAHWPNHSQDALVKQLVDACILGDGFEASYQRFADARDRAGDWRQCMFALLMQHVVTAVGAQGYELTAARSAQDTELAFDEAFKEALWRQI